MIFATANNIPAFVLEKIILLFKLLTERKKEFEAFACKVKDKALKRTVLTLAQETKQYAHELSGQIETMGGHTGSPDGAPDDFQPSAVLIPPVTDILDSCEISENKIIRAYRNVLNEPFLNDNLRNLIRTQLNGLTCAFMQIRLLNAALFHG